MAKIIPLHSRRRAPDPDPAWLSPDADPTAPGVIACDEPTVVTRPPLFPDPAATILDEEATVIGRPPRLVVAEPMSASELQETPEVTVICSVPSLTPMTARSATQTETLTTLFAEPPRLPESSPLPVPVRRWTRRRRLLVIALILAGGWVSIGAWKERESRAPNNAVLAVRPSAIEPAHQRLVPSDAALPTPYAVRPTQAAGPLADGRYSDALPQYLRLAADNPGDDSYRTVAEILIRELDARCRAERNTTCVPAPSLP